MFHNVDPEMDNFNLVGRLRQLGQGEIIIRETPILISIEMFSTRLNVGSLLFGSYYPVNGTWRASKQEIRDIFFKLILYYTDKST
jgi:hypothetical protein